MFKVELRKHNQPSNSFNFRWFFDIIEINTNKSVGSYNSGKYARNQAKRKYKLEMRLIERAMHNFGKSDPRQT